MTSRPRRRARPPAPAAPAAPVRRAGCRSRQRRPAARRDCGPGRADGPLRVEEILAVLPQLAGWPDWGVERRAQTLLRGRHDPGLAGRSSTATAGSSGGSHAGADAGKAWFDELSGSRGRTAGAARRGAARRPGRSAAGPGRAAQLRVPHRLQRLQAVRRGPAGDRARGVRRDDPPRRPRPGWPPARCITGWSRWASSSCTPGATSTSCTVADVEEIRAWSDARVAARRPRGSCAAWDLLRGVGCWSPTTRYRAMRREGQLPTAVLVDRYGIGCAPVREVLIRYLDERRPGPGLQELPRA